MTELSRRSALLAAPLAAGGLLAASAPAALASPARPADVTVIKFTARRKNVTLPASPSLGTPFSAYLELTDEDGSKIGVGSVDGTVVDVILGVPPKIVVQARAIFRLPGGEVHTSNMHVRTVPGPGKVHPIAIIGGTGKFSTARGDGTLEHVDADNTEIVLNLDLAS